MRDRCTVPRVLSVVYATQKAKGAHAKILQSAAFREKATRRGGALPKALDFGFSI
jgi:hypothetical protein